MRFASSSMIFASFVSVFVLVGNGCQRDKANADAASDVREESPQVPIGPVDPAFAEQIHATAVGYFDYPRVDDRPHWAPGPCANTKAVADEPRVGMSSAGSNSLHKEKLYYLFVKDYGNYLKPTEGSAPVGQVVVKQAYIAAEITKDNHFKPDDPRVVERSGRKYTTGDALALFIMMKLDEKTPNTDHGWIYGVADFNGEVKSAGVIEACASCHAHAGHDRLFGSVQPAQK